MVQLRTTAAVGACILAAVLLASAAADEDAIPPGLHVVALDIFPQRIALRDRFDYRQLLVTGRLENGEQVDLTRASRPAQPPQHVRLSAAGEVRPLVDGSETLEFTWNDLTASVTVDVQGSAVPRAVSFVRDIEPALSRMGCNAGTCHGSKNGKNGFKLSLRGYDPLFDHQALTDDHAARRFNRAAPDHSLMLLKATGSIPHVGGVRTRIGEPYYAMLLEWIRHGTPLDLDSPRVTSIEVLPHNPVLPRPGMRQQIVVLATFSDGAVRDVTAEAFIESGNIELLEALPGGVLKTLRRGESPVLVRYSGNYAATTVTVMGDRSGFAWQPVEPFNYVDEHVYSKLQRMKILPSDVCADDAFIRRVTLDLTGLPPTADAVRAFLADARPTQIKRDELIDALIGSPEFVEYWTNKWSDLLQVNRKFLGEEGAAALRGWIQNAVATNMPYDQFAREILTASGSTLEHPPAAYFKILRDPLVAMENTTHLFLAVRFNCNKCHDHPFERWTQDQYYHMAAYFAQVGRKGDPAFAGQQFGGTAVEGATPLVEVIFDQAAGEVRHERTGEIAEPAFPFTHADTSSESLPRRGQLAHWLTSPQNPYFARSYVNRLWGYLLGVGIIEPIDDIRAGNPPTNPALLDALTDDFLRSRFDIQHMMRTVCRSRTYQHALRTNRWNEDDEVNYSHALARRLPAEVLFDAIHRAVGVIPHIPGAPAGFRAAQLPDAGVSLPFLDDLGRPPRESACECERTTGLALGPVMKLINGPTIADVLVDPHSELAQLVAAQGDDRLLIDEIFLRFLARRPTDAERQKALDAMQNAGQEHTARQAALEAYEQQLAARQAAWEAELKRNVIWVPLLPADLKSDAGATLTAQGDTILASGKNGQDTYTVVAETPVARITGLRLEALPDAVLPSGGPGRASNGNFVVNELQVEVASQADQARTQVVALSRAEADFSQSGWDVAGAIDSQAASGWAVMPAFNQRHVALFEFREDSGFEGGSRITVRIVQHYPDGTHTLGKFRLAVTSASRPLSLPRVPAAIASLVALPPDQRTAEQQAELRTFFTGQDRHLAQLREAAATSAEQFRHRRLTGAQDLAWALINTPAFLFNR